MGAVDKIKLQNRRVFYRIHWCDAPAFSPENAYSLPWGMWQWVNTSCDFCDPDSPSPDCLLCSGTGKITPLEGYSCCNSMTDLVRYFDDGGRVGLFECIRSGAGKVYAFTADWINPRRGPDGEPLVVPGDFVLELSLEDVEAILEAEEEGEL